MALVPREIPFTANPQSVQISLSGVVYRLTIMWNAEAACWVLDVADINGVPILSGVPLITGADLLAQYEYLGIGGQMQVQTDNDTFAVPTFDNLGTLGHLYYLVEEDA